MEPADRLRRKLDQEHGVKLTELTQREEEKEQTIYGQEKKLPQTPGKFKLIDQMQKSKSYFEQFLDPELVAKNIDA